MEVQPAPTTDTVRTPDLLRLPLELRYEIYRYLIPTKRLIKGSNPYFKYELSYKLKEDVPDSDESRREQDKQTLSEAGIPGNDLPKCEKEGDDPESHLLEDVHMKGVVDFGGCTARPYKLGLKEWGARTNMNSIFLVCKQISDEALDVLYGENAFTHFIHVNGGRHLERNFPEANRRRMRMLLLVAQYRRRVHCNTPDNPMWSSIIPNLRILRLVADQPKQETSWCFGLHKMKMEGWRTFMRAFLNCFRQHLPEGRLLEVDFNGDSETGELVRDCMAGRYREVRCRLVGDVVFRRQLLSNKSNVSG
ncbi:hypothetical protein PVAG01_08747 [Phlyctema vagabunda]|uniref:Uncharacterized protein n=1 Tax=Phlyctema vagabunda TaxID=108571 RepID=A0ABR4PAE1_9HELO